MNFIKKIFDKKIDKQVHIQFQKFSRGEFINRALIKAKNSNGKYTIYTSSEFANDLVRIVAEKIGNEKTKVTGAIISTGDLKGKLDFKEIKQFQGVKRYIIDKDMSGEEIINLLNEFPKNFFALSFEAPEDETKLKIKPKSPKSAKAKNKEETPKADFCSIKTKDKKIAENFIFEKPDFKEAEVNHTFIITEIIIPEDLKNSTDFLRIREESKRKGKIIRKSKIDGQEITKEFDFEA